MKLTRVSTDEHRQGHLGGFEIPLRHGGPIGQGSEEIPARAVIFRTNDPGYDDDRHTAPRRPFLVLRDGPSRSRHRTAAAACSAVETSC